MSVAMNMQGGLEEDPKYKCCCNSCHSKVGVIVFSVLSLLFYGGSLIAQLVGYANRKADCDQLLGQLGYGNYGNCSYNQQFGSMITLGICLLVVILVFIGICTKKGGFFIPMMVILVLMMLGAVIWLVVVLALGPTVILVFFGMEQDNLAVGAVAVIVGIAVALGLIIGGCIWFFILLVRCYRFFRDSAAMGGGAVYTPGVQK